MTRDSDAAPRAPDRGTGDRRPYRRGTRLLILWAAACLLVAAACKSSRNRASSSEQSGEQTTASKSAGTAEEAPAERPGRDEYRAERERMVREQIAARDVDDPDVLKAMRAVPRHRFVPEGYVGRAYDDTPLPIGHDQTISQPYIVAAMTQALQVDSDHKVLEIGTGSGYQAAILGELAAELYSIEIVCPLAKQARRRLERQGYDNIDVRCGDGYKGWPGEAPFDRIIVTAAPPEIPQALIDQLAVGGRMVLPVGEHAQELKIVRKKSDGSIETVELMDVRFVPMVRGDDAG